MQRPKLLSSLRYDEQNLLNEQAEKLFKLCDIDAKGFIVKADIVHLDGLVPNVGFDHLCEFFDANDTTRTGMVRKEDFIHGIKQLLVDSSSVTTQADFRRHKLLRNLPSENFKTISLESTLDNEERPCTKNSDMRGRMSIRLGTSPSDGVSVLWSSRGLAKISSEMTPSPSTSSLCAPITVHIQESPRGGSPNLTTAPLSDNPETRNHSEFTQVFQRSACSHSDLFRLGSDTGKTSMFESSLTDDFRNTERLYKVVLVGDSAVGKSCFLHRFCHNRFKPLFNATIGVDFTIKNIQVHNRIIAVQLWDTAGQERFRSITKQYFRNADGVILLYDVTSEQSFLNTRNWIESIRSGVDDCCVLCLVANKIDLCPIEQSRTVTYLHGKELAEEYQTLYFETSAFTGLGINDCMRAVAVALLQRDEDNIDEALKLEVGAHKSAKKSWCCV